MLNKNKSNIKGSVQSIFIKVTRIEIIIKFVFYYIQVTNFYK